MSEFGKGFVAGSILSGDSGESSGRGCSCSEIFWLLLFVIGVGAAIFLWAVYEVIIEQGVLKDYWFWLGIPLFGGFWDLYVDQYLIEINPNYKWIIYPLVSLFLNAIIIVVPNTKSKISKLIEWLTIYIVFPLIGIRTVYYIIIAIF